MSDRIEPAEQADPVQQAFAPVLGLPAWGVARGHGSMLTFEFGEPNLSIREPIVSSSPNRKVRELMGRRRVMPVGAWYLWVYACNWRCISHDREIAHSEASDTVIDRTARTLDGQRLMSVQVDQLDGSSSFTFDLGGRLETRPYAEGNDEQWSLTRRQGAVFSYRKDGHYCWSSADTSPDMERWLPWPAAGG